MKNTFIKIIPILFLSFSVLMTYAQTDTLKKTYYLEGKLETMGNRNTEGNKIGTWTTYYESGKTKSIENFIDGKKDGENKTFYENGNIKKLENHKQGNLHGDQIDYHENGNIYWQKKYIYDIQCDCSKQEGYDKIYNTSGQLIGANIYKNGLQEGESKSFYDNGKLRSITINKKNWRISQKNYNENGTLSGSFLYDESGRPHGEHKYFDNDGKLKKIITYFHGNATKSNNFK